jgi:hypothetical protein
MNASELLVTGGTGTLGSRGVTRLRGTGGGLGILSRSGEPGTITGDLITGEGLANLAINLQPAIGGVGIGRKYLEGPFFSAKLNTRICRRFYGGVWWRCRR